MTGRLHPMSCSLGRVPMSWGADRTSSYFQRSQNGQGPEITYTSHRKIRKIRVVLAALGQLTETNTLGAHGVTLEVAVLWLIVGSSRTDVFQNDQIPHTDLHSAVSTNVATRHDLKALHGKHSSILGTCI